MHWLSKFKDEPWIKHYQRTDAINYRATVHNLTKIQITWLEKHLTFQVPYEGRIQIESCDCLDGSHVEEGRKLP